MEMTMTADEAREFLRELDRWRLEPDNGLHADYIGIIEGETYRNHSDRHSPSYRCVHRTRCYATFEATDPETGETVTFRRKISVLGKGSPTASIGYIESCKTPFKTPYGFDRHVDSCDLV